MDQGKKLYRSTDNSWIAGVCGGLGEYFNIDATVIRLATVVLAVVTGFIPFVIVYVLAAVIMPSQAPAQALGAAPSPPTVEASSPATLPEPGAGEEPPAG